MSTNTYIKTNNPDFEWFVRTFGLPYGVNVFLSELMSHVLIEFDGMFSIGGNKKVIIDLKMGCSDYYLDSGA